MVDTVVCIFSLEFAFLVRPCFIVTVDSRRR